MAAAARTAAEVPGTAARAARAGTARVATAVAAGTTRTATATDLNGHRGLQSVAEGAAPIVAAAVAGPRDGGPATFTGVGGVVPW
ncbi:hypothetical protein AB0910_24675 [Streptomyces sp. NPDC047002]|uniref:hypothetical protein n=1 Tax=Streptomyces sp. NPDC047002 TaxID=3155475 RepID=UPI0034512156